MKRFRILVALGAGLVLGSAGAARAGAPQPEQRQGDFAHTCLGGPRKALACTVPTQDVDCPKSECVITTLSKPIPGTLTLVAHDTVTDWLNGGAGNRALTAMLEVRAPDGSKQMLAGTYQDLAAPTNPPEAPGNVVAIPMDELALANLSNAVDGLLFVRPESTLGQRLQTLFATTGTPVLYAVAPRSARFADHTDDDLATVLRFKVKVRFVEPL